jgi:hypothetical protein
MISKDRPLIEELTLSSGYSRWGYEITKAPLWELYQTSYGHWAVRDMNFKDWRAESIVIKGRFIKTKKRAVQFLNENNINWFEKKLED